MIAGNAVLDSSTLLRAAVDRADAAREWVERVQTGQERGLAPDLVHAEVANALARYVRDARMSREQAQRGLRAILDCRIEIVALSSLASAALALAVSRRITAYDACYAALAEAAGAVLVTADRRLAEAVERAVLIA